MFQQFYPRKEYDSTYEIPFEMYYQKGYRGVLFDYRVKPFADTVKTPYVFKAGKPSPRGYQEGMKRMQTTPETTLFVGDQIFTDVWGANRAGVYSILVKQIARHEEIQIVLKRKLEKIVLRSYRKQK